MQKKQSGWSWIPTLYFAEGLPYFIVTVISVILYKRMGVSNSDIALYTSWLYLPWVIKPFWSPLVEMLGTRRAWINTMQIFIGALLGATAFTIPINNFFQWTLAIFWLMAFGSATHDIAADGFYMLGLTGEEQSFFSGIRSIFYRIATIFGQGVLIIIAGRLEETTGSIITAWSITFTATAIIMLLVGTYHTKALPTPQSDISRNVKKVLTS